MCVYALIDFSEFPPQFTSCFAIVAHFYRFSCKKKTRIFVDDLQKTSDQSCVASVNEAFLANSRIRGLIGFDKWENVTYSTTLFYFSVTPP